MQAYTLADTAQHSHVVHLHKNTLIADQTHRHRQHSI